MTDLEKQVEKYCKSKDFQTAVNSKMATDKNFCGGGTKKIAEQYGKRMKEILREEISDIVSETTGEAFLDHIIVSVHFEDSVGWVADVSFDESEVTRDTFSNTYSEAFLPYLINNSWVSSPLGRAWGYDRHGQFVGASDKYMLGQFKGFMKRAVDRFNAEVNNGTNNYDEGTL
ncbi:MAG: hypothetical protein RR490_10600 [Niameybacter sp.]